MGYGGKPGQGSGLIAILHMDVVMDGWMNGWIHGFMDS